MPNIARDDIAGSGRCATNRVVGRANGDINAIAAVPQGRHTACVRANEVALYGVCSCAVAVEVDAILQVAGDDVPCSCSRPSNYVVAAAGNSHPRSGIAKGSGSGNISSNKVALYKIEIAVNDEDTVGVGRNDIARRRRRATDGVITGAPGDVYAAATAAKGSRPVGIRANQVALHRGKDGAHAINVYAITVIVGNNVPRAWNCASDYVAVSAPYDVNP